MIFGWLRRRRRDKILAMPFPAEWLSYLERFVPQYALLTGEQQARLRDNLRVFIAEKNWEGCAGLEVTDEMKVTIAAEACLMALELPRDPFSGVLSILIYPSAYVIPRVRPVAGLELVGKLAVEGTAEYRGPVILSWADVRRDARHAGRGRNLVWHEFAHQIDMLDRSTNGTPPLDDPAERQRWHDVMTPEFEQLRADLEEGRPTWLGPHAAENEAEFFAFVSEAFFDSPIELEGEHPALYALLRDYYRQDPAERLRRANSSAGGICLLRFAQRPADESQHVVGARDARLVEPLGAKLLRALPPRKHSGGSAPAADQPDPSAEGAGNRHRGRVVRYEHFRLGEQGDQLGPGKPAGKVKTLRTV